MIFITVMAIVTPAHAIMAVYGNVRLDGNAEQIKRLVPRFRACGATKIKYDNYWKGRASLEIDQDPKQRRIYACVKRLALAQRPKVSVDILPYGQYEI